VAILPTAATAVVFLCSYLACRIAIASVIGIYGLQQHGLWKEFALIPVWDAMAFWIWLVSFTRKSIMWRKVEHPVEGGQLVRDRAVPVSGARKTEKIPQQKPTSS
jgi:hypothetical protein